MKSPNMLPAAILLFAALSCAPCEPVAVEIPPEVVPPSPPRPEWNVVYSAHRGLTFNGVAPENSVHSVRLAALAGYDMVEIDVCRTSDGVLVAMHDWTINRTMRNRSDYSKITDNVAVERTTYERLRNDYLLASPNEAMRTEIPTLEMLLTACKEYGIVPMLHYVAGDIDTICQMAVRIVGDRFVMFTANKEMIGTARSYAGDCTILYANLNGDIDEIIEYLRGIGGDVAVSTMTMEKLTPENITKFTDAGIGVQASIPDVFNGVARISAGITMLLTDYACPDISEPNVVNITPDDGYSGLSTSGSWDEGVLKCLDGDIVRPTRTFDIGAAGGGVSMQIIYSGTIEISVPGHNPVRFDSSERTAIPVNMLIKPVTRGKVVITSRSDDTVIHALWMQVTEYNQ